MFKIFNEVNVLSERYMIHKQLLLKIKYNKLMKTMEIYSALIIKYIGDNNLLF